VALGRTPSASQQEDNEEDDQHKAQAATIVMIRSASIETAAGNATRCKTFRNRYHLRNLRRRLAFLFRSAVRRPVSLSNSTEAVPTSRL
jgi:hypothetical protein